MSEPTPGVRCRHGHRITLPWVWCYMCRPRPDTFPPAHPALIGTWSVFPPDGK